jgi:hypothetical protein
MLWYLASSEIPTSLRRDDSQYSKLDYSMVFSGAI